jgi:predicted DNA-binding antitoxin AbrB/MazE fold protein
LPTIPRVALHHPSSAKLLSHKFSAVKESFSLERGLYVGKNRMSLFPGTVEKIIPSPHPTEPEKAQISLKDGEDLYKEIRIEKALQDEDGNEVALKEGAEVEVTVEAAKKDTTPKP